MQNLIPRIKSCSKRATMWNFFSVWILKTRFILLCKYTPYWKSGPPDIWTMGVLGLRWVPSCPGTAVDFLQGEKGVCLNLTQHASEMWAQSTNYGGQGADSAPVLQRGHRGAAMIRTNQVWLKSGAGEMSQVRKCSSHVTVFTIQPPPRKVNLE